MPPKKTSSDALYVISSFIWDNDDEVEGLQQPEVYTSLAAANAAAHAMMVRYAEKLNPMGDVDDHEFHHNQDENGLYYGSMDGGPGEHVATKIKVSKVMLNAASVTTKDKGSKVNGKQKVKKESDDDEDDDAEGDDDDDEDEDTEVKKPVVKKKTGPPKTAIKPQTHRKTIPAGKPSCLRGLKILFTGTFETMDRKTSVATAIKYGAEVITKLEDTDYIVVGLRAGPKKLQEINEKELETIDEEEFFQILENGLSEEKKERMAARRAADANEEADPEAEGGRKRAAAASRGAAKKKARK